MPYLGRSSNFGVRTVFQYLPSAGDTSVSGADADGKTLSFADGNYIDVSMFDYNFLNNFNINTGYKKYNYIFSALDIFIDEFIYLFIITLISVEIYLRKRIGLL